MANECHNYKVFKHCIIDDVECGWCVSYAQPMTNSTCISNHQYCSNATQQAQCKRFSNYQQLLRGYPCSPQSLFSGGISANWLVYSVFIFATSAFLSMTCLSIVYEINRRMEVISSYLFKYVICVNAIALVYIEIVTIWTVIDYYNKTIRAMAIISWITCILIPVILTILIAGSIQFYYQFVKFLKLSKSVGLTELNNYKYILFSLVFIIYALFLALCVMAVLAFYGYEYINGVTFFSLLFLWIDLKELTLHIQTEESRYVWSDISPCNNEYRQINDQHDDDGTGRHDVTVLVWELFGFAICIIGCVALALAVEKFEPCFMNLATVIATAVHMRLWAKHNQPGYGWISILVLYILGMLGLTIVSCSCFSHNCRWSHLIVISMVVFWSSVALTTNMLCKKRGA
eukprot:206791_1